MASLCALCWDIDDKVDLMSKDQVKKVRRLLLDLSYRDHLYAVLIEVLRGSCGTEDAVSLCLESRCDVEHLFLVGITDGHDHVLVLRKLDACALECLVKGLVEVFAIPRHSPVDFISGPRLISAPRIFSKENTGIFTA